MSSIEVKAIESLHAHFQSGAGLDIGCGEGRLTVYLAQMGYHMTGIDVSSEAVRRCRNRTPSLPSPPELVVGDFMSQDLGSGTFDFALDICGALSTISRAEVMSYFARLRRTLKAGGWYIFLTYSELEAELYKSCLRGAGIRLFLWSVTDLGLVLEKAGFRVVQAVEEQTPDTSIYYGGSCVIHGIAFPEIISAPVRWGE